MSNGHEDLNVLVDEPDEQKAGVLMQDRGVTLFETSGLLADEGKGSREVDPQFDTEDRSTRARKSATTSDAIPHGVFTNQDRISLHRPRFLNTNMLNKALAQMRAA